ncbi:alanine racemase [Gluconobacter sp.]|uniref:alanine racemase n=1 Tax=Gluconobacter sp. TaxID=1876758 RepID=UPI0039E90CED
MGAGAEWAAVVKANACGLGVDRVAPALAARGAETFFVAHLDEGISLRATLPEARIFVLHGFMPGCEDSMQAHALMPVACAERS